MGQRPSGMRRVRALIVSATVAVAAAAGLTLGGPVGPASAQSFISLPVTTKDVTITTHDGNTLAASVAYPVLGTWPVVILPGTFAGDAITLVNIGKALAARGFVTVTYNERGFGKSTGYLDAGGLDDVKDASDALTWAQANLPAKAGAAGITSVSYGAGFAPIAAALDKRFTAVAMISGWGDMWESRYPNNTPAWASNVALDVIANTQGRPSQATQKFFDQSINNQMTPFGRAFAAERSPKNYLTQLDANHPALYMSTTMNEMIWPINQTLDFYNRYTGPKHLDLLPGDHATTNAPQFLGWTDVTWQTAFDWLDTHLTGDPSARNLPAVRVAQRGPDGTDVLESGLWKNYPFESYPNLAAASGSKTVRQYLNSVPGLFGTVTTTLSDAAGTGTKPLRQGTNALLNNGIPMFQGIFEDLTGAPTTTVPDLIDQGVTGLWYSPAATEETEIRGSADAHLEITPSAAVGSVFVYLLERAPNSGTTYVITHKPYSWSGATPGRAMTLDVKLPYNSYNVPAGHKIILGVSTGDIMYTSENPPGSTVKIGPGSYLDLPLK